MCFVTLFVFLVCDPTAGPWASEVPKFQLQSWFDLVAQGKNPLQLDSRPPKIPVAEFMRMENRFRMLEMSNPEAAKVLFKQAQEDVDKRRAQYEYLASRSFAIEEEVVEEEQG